MRTQKNKLVQCKCIVRIPRDLSLLMIYFFFLWTDHPGGRCLIRKQNLDAIIMIISSVLKTHGTPDKKPIWPNRNMSPT
jgi:hypothetical protein